MSTIKEIENAVISLPQKELAKFQKWFEEFQAKVWDQQLEQDVKMGKLDKLAKKAEKEFRAGRCKEL